MFFWHVYLDELATSTTEDGITLNYWVKIGSYTAALYLHKACKIQFKLISNNNNELINSTKRGKVSLTSFWTLQNYGSLPNHPQI